MHLVMKIVLGNGEKFRAENLKEAFKWFNGGIKVDVIGDQVELSDICLLELDPVLANERALKAQAAPKPQSRRLASGQSLERS